MDFLVAASPHLEKPLHLSPVLPYLLATERSPQFFCFSAPPRHGKSVLTNHYVAWMMLRHPGIRVAYGCYSEELAFFFSKEVKDILTSNGVEVDRTQNSMSEWKLTNGSSFKAVSPGSGFTGRGADLVIVDDPFKNRVAAASGAIRESTWSWFTSVAITRRSPNCSVIVTHTRWHEDDVIGRLASDKHKKPFINMPAIKDDGTALWPTMWPVDRLINDIKATIGEYEFTALYMGAPRPLGGAVFNECSTYSKEEFDKLIEEGRLIKYTIGIDLAYTAKASADYSVAVVMAHMNNGKSYVVNVKREQCDTTKFAEVLRNLRMQYDNPTIDWFVGGQEKVVAEMFRNTHKIPIKDTPAKEDKFARAQAVAAAWNSGKVLIPDFGPWVSSFLSEVAGFTGLQDSHEDQVDALASAWVRMAKSQVQRGHSDDPRYGFF